MKWNARAFVNATFDFEIEAETDTGAKLQVKEYLKFVQGGRIDSQGISVKTKPDDACTHIFLDVDEVTDVYEL